MISDATVVTQVLNGDIEAYAELVARHRDRCWRYAVYALGDVQDAEEALQDGFLRAYRSLGKCRDPDQFGAWLFQIVMNRCRTTGARRGRRERTIVRDEAAVHRHEVPPGQARREWREEIQRALTALDEAQRDAFLMKHVEDMDYEEMARVTGVSVSALKMRVKRACDRMREMLAEVAHDNEWT
jgi:RNA polymerase sigma-70 factor, ECF subfamily